MDSPSLGLAPYQQSARAVAAKASLPLAAALLPASTQAQVVVATFDPPVVASYNQALYFDFDLFGSGESIASPGYAPGATDAQISIFHYILGTDSVSSLLSIHGTTGSGVAAYTVNDGDGLHSWIAQSFARGAIIGSALTWNANNNSYFNSYNGAVSPAWASGSGYVGFKLYSSADSAMHYGWMKLSTNADATEVTVLAVGYNQTGGASIQAGEGPTPVPEPATSAALLALGAAGLVAYRRRKNLQRVSA